MSLRTLMGVYQFGWMVVSHYQQSLQWRDAKEARIGRVRAETQAAAQLDSMMDANPSGALGNARLNDPVALRRSGLL